VIVLALALYLSPATLVADPEGRLLYVAEYTARQVAVFDIAGQKVLRSIALPGRPSGMALSGDGERLYVTAGKVYTVDVRSGAVLDWIPAGHTPGAPVLGRDGKTLYVCNRFDESVSVLDLQARTERVRIRVGREPVAAALSADGRHLLVANQLPSGPSNAKEVAAEVSVIDTEARRAMAPIRLPDGSTGVRDLCLSPDGRYLYVTHLLARYQLPASQIERGWIQTNALSVIDAGKMRLLSAVLLDDITLGAANPWGVACTQDGKYLCVAHAGTHELSVIDRAALHRKLEEAGRGARVSDVSSSTGDVVNDLTFLTGLRTRAPLPGNGPRGLAVAGAAVYAAEYFSESLAVVDLGPSGRPEVRSVKLGPSLPLSAERRGEILFHDAQYCYQKWLSCASCHPNEGRPDGLNWDLMLDGVGNPKNTKSLLLAHQTPPTTITGTRPNAEVSVRAGFRHIQFTERQEADAASVDAYLKSLQPLPSPYLDRGQPSAAAGRGRKVFEDAGCGLCHAGPHYTNLRQYSVGTGRGQEKGRAYDVPTLIEVWRTAPYLHDGRAATLQDLFTAPDSGRAHSLGSRLKAEEIEDLVAFVLSL
jgi:YVTN family beta-propeller protein